MEYVSIVFQEVYRILFLLVPILVSVAMVVWLDRRVWAFVQKRQGPNVVGPFGLLQSLADALKYIFKEIIIPASSNKVIFILAPIITMTLALIAWAVIPFNEGQVLANINVGMEVECLGACVNAPMMQINNDYYEDLDKEKTLEILDKILKGENPKPGSYRGRINNEPENNRKTLMDLKNA